MKFYITFNVKKGYYIEHYDKDLNLVKNYDLALDSKRSQITQAFLIGENLCLLESSFNKEEKRLDYVVHKTPTNGFKFQKSVLFSVPFAVRNGILNNDQTDIIFQGRRKNKKQIMKVSL